MLIAVKLLLNVCDIASPYVNSRVPSNHDEKRKLKVDETSYCGHMTNCKYLKI